MQNANSSSAGEMMEAPWSSLIPEEQWVVFNAGARAIAGTGLPFLLGGALAMACYTGHWRNTKDIDVIVHPQDHERVIQALRAAGFADYFDREAYDRSWIFRGYKDGVIFDVFWQLPNHRVEIDDEWFNRARTLYLQGRAYAAAPAEELIRVKLYVMQRNRCDWVDVLNILASSVAELDWGHLVRRMGRDLPLLHAVLTLFNWMCPGRAQEIPADLRLRFALSEITSEDLAATEERRARLLDSRPWFAPHQPADRPLQL
jgi:hypothetical protein